MQFTDGTWKLKLIVELVKLTGNAYPRSRRQENKKGCVGSASVVVVAVVLLLVVMAVSKKLARLVKKYLRVGKFTDSSPRRRRRATSFPYSCSSSSSAGEISSDGSCYSSTWRSSWGHAGRCSSDRDEEPPNDVPVGCLAVYVGEERRRFVIETCYLQNHVFRALLAKSEEEFGFEFQGGLRIACCPDVFEHFMWWLEGAAPAHSSLKLEPWWL